MNRRLACAAQRGATLAELLVCAAVLVIAAAVMIPALSFNDSSRLAVAAEKVGNALRFARSEAMRTGAEVLVDAETAPGRILLRAGGCSTAGSAAPVLDRLTRRPFDVDVNNGHLSGGVQMTARFLASGSAWSGLVFDARGQAVQACSVAAQLVRGTLATGSGIDLAYSGLSQTIAIDPPTGRVSGF